MKLQTFQNVSNIATQVKTDYEEHAAKEHPEDLPEDLTPEPVAKTGADLNSMQVTSSWLSLFLSYLSSYVTVFILYLSSYVRISE